MPEQQKLLLWFLWKSKEQSTSNLFSCLEILFHKLYYGAICHLLSLTSFSPLSTLAVSLSNSCCCLHPSWKGRRPPNKTIKTFFNTFTMQVSHKWECCKFPQHYWAQVIGSHWHTQLPFECTRLTLQSYVYLLRGNFHWLKTGPQSYQGLHCWK